MVDINIDLEIVAAYILVAKLTRLQFGEKTAQTVFVWFTNYLYSLTFYRLSRVKDKHIFHFRPWKSPCSSHIWTVKIIIAQNGYQTEQNAPLRASI